MKVTRLPSGTVYPLPLRRERGFVPNLRDIPEDVLRRARMLIVNYPHNPTGAVAPAAHASLGWRTLPGDVSDSFLELWLRGDRFKLGATVKRNVPDALSISLSPSEVTPNLVQM